MGAKPSRFGQVGKSPLETTEILRSHQEKGIVMKKLLASLLAIFFVTLAFASPAYAQSRTWVSGVGDDLNPCSRTAPCKTFAGAISKTSAGGEISCLDPGGFGSVTIAKSITIDCVGTNGSILSSNTNGITVNGAGIVVTLRNITIDGVNTTTGNGIRILQAAAVDIDNVTIENVGGSGVSNGRGVTVETSTANVRVNIQNSRIYNANNFAIHSNPSGGNVILFIDNVTMSRGATTAVQLRQLTSAFMNRTSITGFASGAAVALELGTANAHISNSFFSNNNFGIFSGNGGAPTTRLFGTIITGSVTAGLSIVSGTVTSYGNNGIRGNNGNEAPSGVATGTQ